MASNLHNQKGYFKFTNASTAITQGAVVVVGDFVCIAVDSIANGATGWITNTGQYRIAGTGTIATAGVPLYWNGTAVTPTPGTDGKKFAGWSASAISGGFVVVDLQPGPPGPTG
jgi:predicted RecA/RadA family phage recombinase